MDQNLSERVDRIVITQLVEMRRIPSKEEVIRQAAISELQLIELDPEYHLLDSLWNFSERQRALFFDKLALAVPAPQRIQDLFHLIAQTELEVATERIREM